jgi:hypothetical protein
MDISTFYALFSATCFTLVGLWWTLLMANPLWMREPALRRACGGVYLAFLLPALMGLFAQVGGQETPLVWRISFVGVAAIGVVSTLRALSVSRAAREDDRVHRLNRAVAIVLYVVIAVIGVVPEIAKAVDLKPIQAEAILLILLVVLAHGLVWRFMTNAPSEGRHEAGAHVEALPRSMTSQR